MTEIIQPADTLELEADRITHAVVMVSSDTAKRWLQRNVRNRPIAETIVGRYRTDMEAGLWRFTGEPIQFDTSGNLSNGQHRLTALSRIEGLSLPFLVVRGVPPEAQFAMDQGRKRTPGQQLGLAGIKDSNLVASVFKVVYLWESGLMFRDNKLAAMVNSTKIQEYVETHPADLTFVSKHATVIRGIDAPPSAVGAFAVIASRTSEKEASDFLHQLYSLVGLSEGHPIHTLERRLRNIRSRKEKVSNRDFIALFIQAFNAYRRNRKITQLLRPAGGAWTIENFPVVK